MDVRQGKEIVWNKVTRDPVLLRPEPTLREVVESILNENKNKFSQDLQLKSLARVTLELMDAHEELEKMISRFQV